MSLNLKNIPIGFIIDSLPQNRPLYKDSGLWQVRSDNMEEVICQQKANESFESFIHRYFNGLDANVHADLTLKILTTK